MESCSSREKVSILRRLARTDLYFLLWFVLNRDDIEHQWLLDRCREVEANPDGYLDLWAREHYKSTIITFGLTIQDILVTHGDGRVGDERTFGIFSHTRPIAKGFLRQIKRELEENALLLSLFPDVLWEEPKRQAPIWSEDGGIVVRRRGNPKEATVEAWGLVDGQPTSKHFSDLVYDDVVTKDSVYTPDMLRKTQESLEHSYNLGAIGGRRRWVGTRYHFNDPYKTLMDRGTAIARVYPGTDDGTVTGNPVFWQPETLAQKRRDMGPHVFGTQILLDPKSEQLEGFDLDWLKYWTHKPDGSGNRYVVVDPANEKKKRSDYTAAWCLELREDERYYVVDFVRDRLSLTERADLVFRWHRRYHPIRVGYEKYGKDADIAHIEDRQERENYRFDIVALAGSLAKPERIKRLVPICEQGRLVMPEKLPYVNYEGRTVDLIHDFKYEEYEPFPVGRNDDGLDSLSRILDDDLDAQFPKGGASFGVEDIIAEGRL